MLPCPPVETTSRSRLAKVTVTPSVRIVPDTRWPGWMRATVNSRVRGTCDQRQPGGQIVDHGQPLIMVRLRSFLPGIVSIGLMVTIPALCGAARRSSAWLWRTALGAWRACAAQHRRWSVQHLYGDPPARTPAVGDHTA
jgi:hypothetical protein